MRTLAAVIFIVIAVLLWKEHVPFGIWLLFAVVLAWAVEGKDME